MKPRGYDILLTTNLELFKKRVKERLGIECPIVSGTGKIWDFRCAFGVLFAEELKGYEWYGHTDFDVVFGRVDQWVTDEFLKDLDVHSNHSTYVCGAWTLYRNTPEVNELFKKSPRWKEIMENPTPTGWVEQEYSRLLENSGLRFAYTFWQGFDDINFKDGKLFEGDREIMMNHFRRTKIYPV